MRNARVRMFSGVHRKNPIMVSDELFNQTMQNKDAVNASHAAFHTLEHP